MDYIDLDGELVKNQSGQDRLLAFFYTTAIGRMMLKPLIVPGVSRMCGRLLSGKMSAGLIEGFIKNNHIDMSDYENRSYISFNDFFTRKVKKGKRQICEDAALVSPSDGKVTVYKIDDNLRLTIKNTGYSVGSLLKNDRLARHFEGGYAYVVRLSVDDYHRYIYPVSGAKSENYHIDGVFHTVNPIANDYYKIYKENTREYTVIRTEDSGYVLQMEVGALLVGRIQNLHGKTRVIRGREKGYFEYGGSTIVVITDNKMKKPRQDILENTSNGYETKILQGQALTG